MMQKMSNEKALTHLDSFMGKVAVAKEAALEDAEANGVIPGEPAGTEKIPVTKDNDACNQTEEKASSGAFAAEKKQDLKDSTGGEEVEDMKENTDGSVADVPPTDFNAGSIDKKSGENSMTEQERLARLGGAIQERLGKTASEEAYAFEKLSAEDQEAVIMFKQAADAHYIDYVDSFAAGMQKKAEDIQAVAEAKGIPPEEAAAVLDDIAAEDPSLVIPSEEGEEEGDLSPEEEAQLEELAQALEAEGVTPEELAAAVSDVAEEDAPGDVEKTAALMQERHESLKNIVRNLMG